MVEIVDGLKAKLVEIDTQIELLRRQIGDLEDQRTAFVKVIKVYHAQRSYFEPPVSCGEGIVRVRPQDGNSLLEHVQISVRYAGYSRSVS